MKPGHLDLPTIWRGCTYPTFTLTWLDHNGDPINLSGWTPQAKSRNIDFHPFMVDATNGVTAIGLLGTETGTLKLGVEQWDWIFVYTDGTVTPPLLSGSVPIKEPITPTPAGMLTS